MSKLVILEGARGTGKSTAAFKLRQLTKSSTLINFTGFHDDGKEGLQKIKDYYYNWFQLLRNMKWKVKDQLIICDRFFPSEMVYSTLYKDYDFTSTYNMLCMELSTLADEVILLNFTINDENELSQRLIRDKVPFGKAEENVKETMRQQDLYKHSIKQLQNISSQYFRDKSVKVIDIDTTGKTIDEIVEMSLNEINR
ncbi:hypothetical protein [Priestia aryabhattai]|uniref:hypothetical protein n=1 Tax=Priestia aryabhattai TaxID=412384 RepID=UPI0021753E73|nr:hypothetical protein [Priestia aryabhattai]